MIIQSRNLRKTFKNVTALDNLELAIQPDEIFGLLGPNGAGKSTFMNLLSGYHTPDSGELLLDGQAYDASNLAQKSLIGLVPQHIALYEELTPVDNLKIFGRLLGLSGKALSEKIDFLLERIELADRRKDLVKGFSGGMKRRLNIASSMLHDPKILLCDEPTVGVDPQSRNAIFDLLKGLNEEGATIIYSTHYMEEAEKLCDRIGIIDHGKILAVDTLENLLSLLPEQNEIACQRAPLQEAHIKHALVQFGELVQNKDTLTLHPKEDFKLSDFFAWVEENELSARWFRIKQPTLENLFLHLTGRGLRE